MTPSPSLAAPLSKALRYHAEGSPLTTPGFMLVPPNSREVLAALRADPNVLHAMAEALHRECFMVVTQHGADAHNIRAAVLLDELLGAGPISSGEAAE